MRPVGVGMQPAAAGLGPGEDVTYRVYYECHFALFCFRNSYLAKI